MYEGCSTGMTDMNGVEIFEGNVLELDVEHEMACWKGELYKNPEAVYKPLLGTVYFAEGAFKIKTNFAYNWSGIWAMASKSRLYYGNMEVIRE